LLLQTLSVAKLVMKALLLYVTSVTVGNRTSCSSGFWTNGIHIADRCTHRFSKYRFIFLYKPRQDLTRPATKSQVVSLNITLWRPYAVSMHSATDCRRPYQSKYSASSLEPLRSKTNVPLCTRLCAGCTSVPITAICVYR